MTTDGERDDQASLHRLLLYANELDIEAIASSSSRWHWAGDPNATPPIPPHRWSGTDGGHDWIPELIDGAYREVYANLVVHDPDFPNPDELLSKVHNGNITYQGEMARNTPGSEAIKSILLDDDPRPVSLQAWGGTNTIAAALRSIADEYAGSPEWASIQQRVYEKAQLYIIQDQDVTYKQYIATAWPGLKTVMNRDQFEAFAYSWAAQNPEPLVRYFQKDWVAENLQAGPYMEGYPLNTNTGHWFSEGDSPAFLHTIPTGLGQFEDPTYGGWGGRFVKVGENVWADDPRYLGIDTDAAHDCSAYPLIRLTLAAAANAGSDQVTLSNRRVGGGVHGQAQIFAGDVVKIGTGESAETRTVVATQLTTRPYTITLDQPLAQSYAVGAPIADYCSTFWPQARWAEAIQLDFAARAAWTVTPSYDDANHAPTVRVPSGREEISAKPGQRVLLAGVAHDPDRDELDYRWWHHPEAGTYASTVRLRNSDSQTSWFIVPNDAQQGDTIHLVLEVSDDGAPSLARYERVIVSVK